MGWCYSTNIILSVASVLKFIKTVARKAPKSVIRFGMHKVYIWCLSKLITQANRGECLWRSFWLGNVSKTVAYPVHIPLWKFSIVGIYTYYVFSCFKIFICKYYILKSLSRLTDPVIRRIIKENSARCTEQETANYARKRFFVRFIYAIKEVSVNSRLC